MEQEYNMLQEAEYRWREMCNQSALPGIVEHVFTWIKDTLPAGAEFH